MIALGVSFDEHSDRAVRDALADVDAAVAPHRAGEYPNFVEAPADARGFFEPRPVWSACAPSRPATTAPTCSRATITSPPGVGGDSV